MDRTTEKKLMELVRRNYGKIADDFNRTRNKSLWPELTRLTAAVKEGNRVLDAGCGNGRLLQAFKLKPITYVGVDSSPELIEAAREKWAVPRGEFKVLDILKLHELGDSGFDYVFCIAVLQHIPGEQLRVEVLKQMKNKLTPGGCMVVSVWNMWSSRWKHNHFRTLLIKYALLKLAGAHKMDFGDILFDWKNSQGNKVSRRYYHAFTKCELRRIAVKAGLRVNKLYKDEYNYYLVLSL